jgi:hypothetical protein
MLPIYNPATGVFANTGGIAGGQNESPEILLLNILIELRVMNAMFWDAQRGARHADPGAVSQRHGERDLTNKLPPGGGKERIMALAQGIVGVQSQRLFNPGHAALTADTPMVW